MMQHTTFERLEPRRLLTGARPGVDLVTFPEDSGAFHVTDPFIGALPDDGVDDTAALQRMFDLITPGTLVYFPEGQYDFSGEVLLRKNVFTAEAEALPGAGGDWETVTEGDRTFLRAGGAFQPDPELSPRLTWNFEAIEAQRWLQMRLRAPDGGSDSVYLRVNGGEWSILSRPNTGDNFTGLQVVRKGIELVTGTNTIEVAIREPGFDLDTIGLGYGNNYLNNIQLQGAGESRTTFKLADGSTNTDGTPFNSAPIRWESGVEQFFRTAVRDLTIDVGENNPEADGLKFHGNNQSTVANVTIKAPAGSGDVGLDLAHTAAIGPILVRDVTVQGFDIGIHAGWQNASRTFDRITVRDQAEYGIVNEAAAQGFYANVLSENAVTAFRTNGTRLPGDGNGRVVLIDSLLRGKPGAEDVDAIRHYGSMYVRDVRTPGYGRALNNTNQAAFRGYRGNDGFDGEYVDEFFSRGPLAGDRGGTYELFDSPDTMLGLEIRDTPTVPWDDPDTWAGLHEFTIEIKPGVVSGLPDDDVDDGPALQAAIDSGASTVYVPAGSWVLESAVELRGNVRRLIAMESSMQATDFDRRGSLVVGPDGPDTVVIERFANFGFSGRAPTIEHASGRTVVVNDFTGLRYRPTVDAPGDVFINDTVGDAIRFAGGQKAWARQLNIEEDTTRDTADLPARIVNDGADVWVLGFKTEMPGVHVQTTNGGRTEMLGQMQLNQFGSGTPQYVTVDAALSVAINIKPYPETGTTYGTVVETRDGETRTGLITGDGYSAFSDADLWDVRREIIVDDAAATYTGDWQQVPGFPGGFIEDGISFTNDPAAAVTYEVPVPEAGRYEVFTRWIGDWGGQAHSGHARSADVVVGHRAGETRRTVDQDVYSDGWYSLGTFSLTDAARISMARADADGVINTDGVKLKRVARVLAENDGRVNPFSRVRRSLFDRGDLGGGLAGDDMLG